MFCHRLPVLGCAALVLSSATVTAVAQTADPVPVMVTYELKKAREAERFIARNPKGFWVRQIVARIIDKQMDLPKPLPDPVTVKVSFVVARDGHLVSKGVAQTSGNADADKTAIAMLDRAQPFPPMPEGVGETELSFTLPVRFR